MPRRTRQAVLHVMLTGCALALGTATSLAAQDRCERYAHRAVEQYALMQHHASCQVKPDLRWQDSYSNHLFACRHMPEVLMKAEEAARDQHLKTCGGLTPDTAAAGQATGGDCKVDLPPSFALAHGTTGVAASVTDGVLRYEEMKKHERKVFTVVRPTYYAVQQRCGERPATTGGPWVSRGTGGASDLYFVLGLNETVQAWPLGHAIFEQLVAPQRH